MAHPVTSSWHKGPKFKFDIDHRNAVLHQSSGSIPLTKTPYMFMGDVAISCHDADFYTLFHTFNNARLAVALYNQAAQAGIDNNADDWENASNAFFKLEACKHETPTSDLVTFIDDRECIAHAAKACALFGKPDAAKSVDTLDSVLAHLAQAGKYKELSEDTIRDKKYALLSERALAAALSFEALCASGPTAENAEGYVTNGAAAVSFFEQISADAAATVAFCEKIQTVEANLIEFHNDAYQQWKQAQQAAAAAAAAP